MNTVLFLGKKNDPPESLSGLWLIGIKRKEGKISRGFVVNGNWDLRLTQTKLKAGSEESHRFIEVNSRPLPEQIIEIQVNCKSDDYNEVIEKARKMIKSSCV